MESRSLVPTWPRITATVHADGTGEVSVNGAATRSVTGQTITESRSAVIAVIAETAEKLHRPVRVCASDPDGDWNLIVHPDQQVEEDPTHTPAQSSRRRKKKQPSSRTDPRRKLQKPQPQNHIPTSTYTKKPPRQKHSPSTPEAHITDTDAIDTVWAAAAQPKRRELIRDRLWRIVRPRVWPLWTNLTR